VAGRFLDSHDPMIRRLSAAAYSAATAITALFLFGPGLPNLGDGSFVSGALGALYLLGEALIVWWLTAGIMLRLVRMIERRRSSVVGHQAL
jgi:hypothetical protein